MQAMIFAAGLGTRLYPITHDKPKALAPFMGTTLLHYNLKFLSQQGVSHFVINTHHFQEKIESYLAKNDFFGLNISLSKEKILMDTAGGLANAAHLFHADDEPILLFNTDVITNLNVARMAAYHISSRNEVTLAVRNRKSSRQLIFDECFRMNGWVNHNTQSKKNESENYRIIAGICLQWYSPDKFRADQENRTKQDLFFDHLLP